MLSYRTKRPPNEYGMNRLKIRCSELDAEIVNDIFSSWYNEEKLYNYDVESDTSDNDATGKFIVRHWMFIVIFFEVLANSHIKYGRS